MQMGSYDFPKGPYIDEGLKVKLNVSLGTAVGISVGAVVGGAVMVTASVMILVLCLIKMKKEKTSAQKAGLTRFL